MSSSKLGFLDSTVVVDISNGGRIALAERWTSSPVKITAATNSVGIDTGGGIKLYTPELVVLPPGSLGTVHCTAHSLKL